MSKQIALTMQRAGMVLIVTVMLINQFVFQIEEGFLLTCAIISAVLLAVSITRLKYIEVKEESRQAGK